ncbi:MAG TPA: hypothetical protein VNM90_26900 [Haliangium sp.]|nr:hypothetical protein [Haliangium sp.]
MILAALFIGLLTAYYFGIRTGSAAAGVALGLFLLVAIVPGAKLLVYGVVALALAAVFYIGPRTTPPEDATQLRRVLAGLWIYVKRRLGRRE